MRGRASESQYHQSHAPQPRRDAPQLPKPALGYRLRHDRPSPGKRRPRGRDAGVRLALRLRGGRPARPRRHRAPPRRRLRPPRRHPAAADPVPGTGPGPGPGLGPGTPDQAPGAARVTRHAAPAAGIRPAATAGFRWVALLAVAWLVFLVAVPWWAWTRVSKVDAFPPGDRPAEQPGATYLVVGSDSREGLTKAERKELGTGVRHRPAHRHDHAAAHRLGTEPADVDPPRLTGRRSPGTGAPRSTRRSRTADPSC